MRTKPLHVPAIGFTSLVALVSAAPSAATQSTSAFVPRANALCAANSRSVHALKQPSSLAEIPQFAKLNLKLDAREWRAMERLRPPRAKAASFRHLIALGEVQDEIVATKLVPAARRGDRAGVQDAVVLGLAAESEWDRAALALGLTVCARPQ